MDSDTPKTVFDRLDALLEEERAALLGGDLDGLNDMHGRKEDLLHQLAAVPADARLRGIQQKLARNQDLLDSALAGIQSVARRLAMVRRVRQSLEYYDEDGAMATVDIGVERSVEKRA